MKWLFILILVVFSILLVVPAIRYHYIYPTAGDDTATHLIYFQNMDNQRPIYYGQYLVGKLINALPFDMKVTFLWFHFAVLILALWSVGLAVGLAVNYWAGALASIILIGKTYLLELFHWGQIFDIVSIAVILPITLLCIHNLNKYKSVGWGLGSVVGIFAFAYFHANGRYIFALIPIVVGYELALSILASKKHYVVVMKMVRMRLLAYSGCLGLVLMFLFAIKYSIEPMRLMMDGSILLAISVCGFLWYIIKKEHRMMQYGAIAVAILVAMPTLVCWEKNNSALKHADQDAIAFLNGAKGTTYTASPLIAQEIYGLFVDKQFQDSLGADYVVVRSLPLSPRSDPQSIYFENQNRMGIVEELSDNGYSPLRVFDYREIDISLKLPIVVEVYGK